MCKSTYILAFTGTVVRNPSQGICIHKTKRGNGWEDAQSNLECFKKCHNWTQFTSELWMFGNWTVENLVHWHLVPGNSALSSSVQYCLRKKKKIQNMGSWAAQEMPLFLANAPSKKLCIRQLSIPNKMVCSILVFTGFATIRGTDIWRQTQVCPMRSYEI